MHEYILCSYYKYPQCQLPGDSEIKNWTPNRLLVQSLYRPCYIIINFHAQEGLY